MKKSDFRENRQAIRDLNGFMEAMRVWISYIRSCITIHVI